MSNIRENFVSFNLPTSHTLLHCSRTQTRIFLVSVDSLQILCSESSPFCSNRLLRSIVLTSALPTHARTDRTFSSNISFSLARDASLARTRTMDVHLHLQLSIAQRTPNGSAHLSHLVVPPNSFGAPYSPSVNQFITQCKLFRNRILRSIHCWKSAKMAVSASPTSSPSACFSEIARKSVVKFLSNVLQVSHQPFWRVWAGVIAVSAVENLSAAESRRPLSR